MKFLLIAIVVFVAVSADVSHLHSEDGYNYNQPAEEHHHDEEIVPEAVQESSQYLPPAVEEVAPQSEEIPAPQEPEPSQDYLPPSDSPAVAAEEALIASIEHDADPEPAHILAEDGYHYKTVKRFRYRYRH